MKDNGQYETMRTLESIHKAAKKEFLEKGFKSASLRNIVKTAGVTTGAFYGYYDSKEELFEALTGTQYERLMGGYREAQTQFTKLSPSDQHDHMGEISGNCMEWMVEYVYENFDIFKLLICCSEGTKYEHMIHEMVEIEVKATHDFIDVLKGMGQEVPKLDDQLEHILISGMFSAFFEMIVHDMPKEKAKIYIRELREFYMAGWQKMLGF